MLSTSWTPPAQMPRLPPRISRPAPVERVDSPRIAALARHPEKTADFWRGVEAEGTPLLEAAPDDPEHTIVTFLWRGSDTTRAVLVLPNGLCEPPDLTGNLMATVPGTDVWHWSVRMPTGWRATYALCVDEGQSPAGLTGPRPYTMWLRTQLRGDPLNSVSFPRRWGGVPLSAVTVPGAAGHSGHTDGDDWERRPAVPAGEVTVHTLRSANLRNWRRVWAYTPAGHQEMARLPVLVLLDGDMWQPRLGVSVLLDNLIAEGRIPPLVALMPDSLDSDTRWDELACDHRFVSFLARELLPWAAERWPITDDPDRTVVAGQGLGGLMSAYAALTAHDRFGNVLAQSGSFWWPAAESPEWLTDRTRRSARRPVRFHISAGLREWGVLAASRRLASVLEAKGYPYEYREFEGGHDYLCWREELALGLQTLLRGPLSAAADRPDA
jgi:enterochelin esterase-like enzyme